MMTDKQLKLRTLGARLAKELEEQGDLENALRVAKLTTQIIIAQTEAEFMNDQAASAVDNL